MVLILLFLGIFTSLGTCCILAFYRVFY